MPAVKRAIRYVPRHHVLHGAGLFDWVSKYTPSFIKDYFAPRLDSFNNVSTKTLSQYGQSPIESVYLMRTPIRGMLTKALDVLSLGKFSELKRKYAFDELYHLSLIATVNGRPIMIEKNATVNINTSFQQSADSQTLPISLNGRQITLYDLLNTARQAIGDTTFFKYNAWNENGGTNCQLFLKRLLQTNGLLTPEADNFLYQDITALKNEMPGYVKNVSQVLTDMGASFNKITGGKRRMRQKIIRKVQKK